MQVRDAARALGDRLLGRVMLHVAAARDGTTLMWAVGHDGGPVALRWQPAMGPWRVRANCISFDEFMFCRHVVYGWLGRGVLESGASRKE